MTYRVGAEAQIAARRVLCFAELRLQMALAMTHAADIAEGKDDTGAIGDAFDRAIIRALHSWADLVTLGAPDVISEGLNAPFKVASNPNDNGASAE